MTPQHCHWADEKVRIHQPTRQGAAHAAAAEKMLAEPVRAPIQALVARARTATVLTAAPRTSSEKLWKPNGYKW
jgi:hypothetical protein